MRTGQIDLFTKRVRKAPAANERATHIAIADTIRLSLAPLWVAYHVPNGELREVRTAELLKRMLVLPGVSDFMFIGPPAGRTYALELKRRGNKPSAAQIAFMRRVQAAGGIAHWVDSYEQAIATLQAWGAVRVRL